MKKDLSERFWEIDFLRGIAVTMMIIFHILYDLNYFNIYKLDLYSLPFLVFLYPIGTIFLLLVGISLTLSLSKAQNVLTKRQLQLKFIIRGLKIFGLGLLITLATWIYLQKGFIVFGVLHCIGISIIILYPFLRLRLQSLLTGIVFICIGILLRTVTFDFYWLVWLGLRPSYFYTADYFPLFPWFGVVLIGIFLGNSLYVNSTRRFILRDFSRVYFVHFFCFLGKHSLVIYFLHQPLIIALFVLFLL